MNKIEKMLKKLCPLGVPFMHIEAVIVKTSNIKWQEQEATKYQYIDLSSLERTTHTINTTSLIT